MIYLYLFLQKNSSTWDERDEDYLPVNKSEISGNVADIVEVFYLAEGKDSSWTYDAKGNRITSSERLGNSHSSKTVEYYANSDLIKKYGDWYFSYDKNGNLTSRGTSAVWNDANGTYDYSSSDGELWLYEYDLSNRMTRVLFSEAGKNALKNKASYTYDYRGLLVRKVTEEYVEYREYTLDGKLLFSEKGDETTDYIYKSNTIFAEIRKEDSSEAVYYHHTDHLGTTEAITDSNGNVVWEAEYEAFGSILNQNGTKVFTASFTGKMYDAEAGMYYFNARWYDSKIGRFITQDPIRDGLNWWNYCNGNPLSFIDWNGLEQSKADLNWASIVQKEYESVKNDPEKFKDFKSKFSIDIYRDKNDNHDNNKYYQSELCVAYNGIPLNSVSVQSTHDWVREANRLNGLKPGYCGTVEPGIYNGKLMASTSKFLEIIWIEGTFEATEIHGDMIDNSQNKDYTGKAYGDGKHPYSLSCQVVHQKDKLEINRILKSFGFIFTNKESEQDNIKVRINSPENPSIFTDRSHSHIKRPPIQSLLKKQEPYFTTAR